MNANPVVVQGIVDCHGALSLNQPVPLPPGAVEVTVQPLSDGLPSSDPFWKAMEEIWAGQRARGHVPRSKEDVDAELSALRSEAEEEMLAVERIHAECRQSSETRDGGSEEWK